MHSLRYLLFSLSVTSCSLSLSLYLSLPLLLLGLLFPPPSPLLTLPFSPVRDGAQNERTLGSYGLEPNDLIQCTFVRYSNNTPLEVSSPASIHHSIAYGAGTKCAVLDLPASFYVQALAPQDGHVIASTQSPLPFTCALEGAEVCILLLPVDLWITLFRVFLWCVSLQCVVFSSDVCCSTLGTVHGSSWRVLRFRSLS
jgi:hypothetical protein